MVKAFSIRPEEFGLQSCNRLVQGLFLVCLDDEVAGGVGDAGQDEAVVDLAVVKEGLIALVRLTALDLSCAAGARAGAAGVWQVESGLLCGVENIGVVCA